jgi:hypothetical protein
MAAIMIGCPEQWIFGITTPRTTLVLQGSLYLSMGGRKPGQVQLPDHQRWEWASGTASSDLVGSFGGFTIDFHQIVEAPHISHIFRYSPDFYSIIRTHFLTDTATYTVFMVQGVWFIIHYLINIMRAVVVTGIAVFTEIFISVIT